MQFVPKFVGYAQKIRNSFDRQSMMATFQADISELAPGFCEISAPIVEGARQQHGFAHAALTFAIGDSAAGYAALTLLNEFQEVLTVEMKINLVAPANGKRLIARGEVMKPGRRLIIVRAEVVAKTGGQTQTIALLQGTMIPIDPA